MSIVNADRKAWCRCTQVSAAKTGSPFSTSAPLGKLAASGNQSSAGHRSRSEVLPERNRQPVVGHSKIALLYPIVLDYIASAFLIILCSLFTNRSVNGIPSKGRT